MGDPRDMVRRIVFALLGCLYVAGSTWLVQSEGRRYRNASRRPRATISDASAASARPPADEAEITPVLEKTVANAAPSPAETSSRKSNPPLDPAPPTNANESPSPPSPPPIQVAVTEPPPSVPRTRPMVPSRVNPSPASVPSKVGGLWQETWLTKQWKLDALSTQDEIDLGAQLHELISQLNPIDRGSGLLRLKEAAQPLLDLRSRKDVPYTFTILNSEIANAFSDPGGCIYISRKLLDMVPEGEDEILQFIIGHEIAHIDLKHAMRCLQARDVRKYDDGTLQKLYFLIIPHAYPDELEFAADRLAYLRMKQLGRSDYECFRFLRKLESYARAEGFADGRGRPDDLLKIQGGDPKASSIISPLDNHLRAHPAPKIRLDKLKQLKDENAKGVKAIR